MAKQRKSVGLIAFLKGSSNPAERMPGCANYDHHYGGCLLDNTCKVQQGKRCSYFERAVLPTAIDIGLKEHIYSLYGNHVGIEGYQQFDKSNIRRCPDCEAELKPRQRYCDECKKRRRRKSYRNSRSKRNS